MRRYGEVPVRGQTYKERPGAYGVITDGTHALLVAEDHPKTDFVDVQMPGGGIDPSETPVQALHREVMEETGYRVEIVQRIATYQRYCYMVEYDMWARKIANIFLCRAVAKLGTPDDLTQAVYWVPLAEMPALITNPADRQFLSEANLARFSTHRRPKN